MFGLGTALWDLLITWQQRFWKVLDTMRWQIGGPWDVYCENSVFFWLCLLSFVLFCFAFCSLLFSFVYLLLFEFVLFVVFCFVCLSCVCRYEMLVGAPPFTGNSAEEVFQAVLNSKDSLKFPSEGIKQKQKKDVWFVSICFLLGNQVSAEAKDLISRFLSPPKERLGYNGIGTIKQHAWLVKKEKKKFQMFYVFQVCQHRLERTAQHDSSFRGLGESSVCVFCF